MKIKIVVAVLALAVMLFGCGQQVQKANAGYRTEFYMDWIDGSGAFDVYRDRETGVQYIVYSEAKTGGRCSGIVPRYNADGTLYVEG